MEILRLRNPHILRLSSNRRNIFYSVRRKNGTSLSNLAGLIHQKFLGKCGLIYLRTTEECNAVAGKLQQLLLSSTTISPYHAKLKSNKRAAVEREWQRGSINVLCATKAFGMGIDKSDVRFVIHYDMPDCIESYVQESGRAGRDGKPAYSVIYFCLSDKHKWESMFRGSSPHQLLSSKMLKLNEVTKMCLDEISCRRASILGQLGDSVDSIECDKMCDNW